METEAQKVPKTDFPQILSSVHSSEAVIMTKIDPESSERFFMSVKDVIEGTAGDPSTLQTYEEFCNYLAQPNIVPLASEEDKKKSQQLFEQKKTNLFSFKKKIDEEKNQVKKLLSDKLQELYKNKCSELVEKLQKELEGQNKLFNDNYEKLEKELRIDREKEAGLTKYEDIKKKVKELHTPSEIENYLQGVYKSKKSWKNATQSIQTLGPRTEDFYEKLIEKQFSNAPKLANVDQLLDTWVSGLDKLITEVKADANIFKNLICSCHLFIPLEVSTIKEFTMVTNEMLKQDTQLQIQLSGTRLNQAEITQFAQHLSKLTNLVHLVIDLDGTTFPVSLLEELIKPFENLKNLQSLQIKAYGAKLGDAGVQSLAKLFSLVPTILGLDLELGDNKITTTGLAYLSEEISKLGKIQCLSIDMQGNPIKSQGFSTFEANFEKIIPMLCGLKLNFSNCTEKTKVATEQSISRQIVKILAKASMVKMLEISIGNNQNENDIVKDLIAVLPNLVSLQDLTMDLNNNKLDLKGANRLAKLFRLNKISSLNLNLSGNQIKLEGAKCIVDVLKTMNILQKLKLNVRNTGIKKGFATQMKTDLEEKHEKFENFEFLA